MAKFLVAKQGVPVLVYLSSPDASQWQCCLIVKHAETHKQATVSLRFSLPSNSSEIVTLLYDADNLVPDETTLVQETISLPGDQLKHVARDSPPQLMRLCLSLQHLCLISCPARLPPKHSDVAFLHHILELASAKRVYILFDHKWVHQQNRALFKQIIDRPQDLTGLQTDSLILYRPGEWAAAFSSAEEAESVAPPSYSAASKKRSVQARASPTSDLPRKRALLERAPDSPPSLDVPRSPTERSIAASTVVDATPEAPPVYDNIYSRRSRTKSPFAPLSDALDSPGSPTEKATTVATPSPKPWSSPNAGASDIDRAVSRAVHQQLPQAVQEALPNELAKLLSTSPTSPSASQPSHRPDTYSKHAFSRLVRAQAASFAKAQLRDFQDETYDQIDRLRSTAVEEFDELLEGKKLDIEIAQDDNLTELNRVFDEKVAEFKEQAEEIVHDVEDRAYCQFDTRLEGHEQLITAVLRLRQLMCELHDRLDKAKDAKAKAAGEFKADEIKYRHLLFQARETDTDVVNLAKRGLREKENTLRQKTADENTVDMEYTKAKAEWLELFEVVAWPIENGPKVPFVSGD